MAKQLLYTDEARKKLLTGAEKLAHAVGITLGPTGRNVIIDKSFGGPTVTKDGVTVSKEIELEDRFENMGAKLVNEVARRPRTSPATAPRRPPCWPAPSSKRERATSPLAATRRPSAVGSKRPWPPRSTSCT